MKYKLKSTTKAIFWMLAAYVIFWTVLYIAII